MNDSFRLSNSFIRCNDSSAESLPRLGRICSSDTFVFFLATAFPLRSTHAPSDMERIP
jgi:hypothetical protein